jgi:predicted ATPase
VQLFVRCVAARAGSFVLTDEEAPFVAEICRKLDGIPLAIELAAGQAAALGLKSTVALLASRMGLLRLSHRTAVPRHRTLKATLDWSYELLSEAERIVFRRIHSAFAEKYDSAISRHVLARALQPRWPSLRTAIGPSVIVRGKWSRGTEAAGLRFELIA